MRCGVARPARPRSRSPSGSASGSARPRPGLAIAPDQVAEQVVDAIVQQKFYLLTHPGSERGVETRAKNIALGRNPR